MAQDIVNRSIAFFSFHPFYLFHRIWPVAALSSCSNCQLSLDWLSWIRTLHIDFSMTAGLTMLIETRSCATILGANTLSLFSN